jgi:DNA-directed RNA polymerase subunit F
LPKVKSARKITIHEAKDLLSQIGSESMDQIQQKTAGYISEFSTIDGKRSRDLVNRIVTECSLEEDLAIQLVNIMPKTMEEVRALLVGWKKLLTSDVVAKIVSILQSKA